MRTTIYSVIGLALVMGIAVLFGQPAEAAQFSWGDHALGGMALGGIIINSANLRDLTTSFRSIYESTFGSTAHRDHFAQIATEVPSDSAESAYGWLGQNFEIRKWVGDRVLQNLEAHDFKIKNEPFEGTIAVDRDDIEDDKLGQFKPMIQQIAHGSAVFPNRLVFRLLNQGASQVCYDGQNFFDTDHLGWDDNGAEISVSNHMGGAGVSWYLLSTAQPLKPFIHQVRRKFQFVAMDAMTDEQVFSAKRFRYGVDGRMNAGYGLWQMAIMSKQDLTHDNYAAARAAMISIRKQNGEPAGFVPDLLVVPASLEGKARKVLVSATRANGEDNEWQGTAKLLMTPWL